MSDVTVTWRGDDILAQVSAAVATAMDSAGKALSTQTKAKIATPFPPASRPGQPPRRRSGGLIGAVDSRTERSGRNVTLRVGVPASSPVRRQAEALQGGTGRMAARPFVPTATVATALVVDAVTDAVRSALR